MSNVKNPEFEAKVNRDREGRFDDKTKPDTPVVNNTAGNPYETDVHDLNNNALRHLALHGTAEEKTAALNEVGRRQIEQQLRQEEWRRQEKEAREKAKIERTRQEYASMSDYDLYQARFHGYQEFPGLLDEEINRRRKTAYESWTPEQQKIADQCNPDSPSYVEPAMPLVEYYEYEDDAPFEDQIGLVSKDTAVLDDCRQLQCERTPLAERMTLTAGFLYQPSSTVADDPLPKAKIIENGQRRVAYSMSPDGWTIRAQQQQVEYPTRLECWRHKWPQYIHKTGRWANVGDMQTTSSVEGYNTMYSTNRNWMNEKPQHE